MTSAGNGRAIFAFYLFRIGRHSQTHAVSADATCLSGVVERFATVPAHLLQIRKGEKGPIPGVETGIVDVLGDEETEIFVASLDVAVRAFFYPVDRDVRFSRRARLYLHDADCAGLAALRLI